MHLNLFLSISREIINFSFTAQCSYHKNLGKPSFSDDITEAN